VLAPLRAAGGPHSERALRLVASTRAKSPIADCEHPVVSV